MDNWRKKLARGEGEHDHGEGEDEEAKREALGRKAEDKTDLLMRESRNALRNGCSRDWLARQNSSGKAARGGLLAAPTAGTAKEGGTVPCGASKDFEEIR